MFHPHLLQIPTLRGTILEEAIPSSGKVGTNKGLPSKEVIDYIVQGDLQTSCLKLSRFDDKVSFLFVFFGTWMVRMFITSDTMYMS